MDVLRNKDFKTYGYTCRYSPFPFYYNTKDKKYIYGLTNQLDTDVEFVAHKVNDYDTLDSLALKYYGRPDLF